MCLGIPGKIIETYEIEGVHMGRIDFGGVVKEACLDFIPEAEIGDYAIIHVGFAISRIDEEEAQSIFDLLAEMDMLADELPELTPETNES
jgi:hydrogenase expression/formation protein HypC